MHFRVLSQKIHHYEPRNKTEIVKTRSRRNSQIYNSSKKINDIMSSKVEKMAYYNWSNQKKLGRSHFLSLIAMEEESQSHSM